MSGGKRFEIIREIKGFKEASKGDTILVVPNWWIFLINYPYKRHLEFEKYLSINNLTSEISREFEIETVKVNEERH